MLDIHMGIRREDYDAFERILNREIPEAEVVAKGDNWDTWKPFDEQDEQDLDILHATIKTLTPMVVLNILVTRFGIFLNPLEDIASAFYGRFLVVTDHDSWNQYYVELSYPE